MARKPVGPSPPPRPAMTKSMVIEICERIAAGESTTKVLAEVYGDPTLGAQRFMRFLNQRGHGWANELWQQALAISCEFNLESLRGALEELESSRADKDAIARQKLLWDAVRWLAAKRLPERYGLGNKQKLTHLTDEELLQLANEHGITLSDVPGDPIGTDLEEAGDAPEGDDLA